MVRKRTKTKVTKNTTDIRQRIYIGPSIPGLRQFTVFVGEDFPVNVQKLIQENVSISGLIVPIQRLSEARKELYRKGSIYNYFLNQFYKQRSQ